MTTPIEEYKREACRGNRGRIVDAAAEWAGVVDWWASGRPLFVQAFRKEVGKHPSKAGIDNLLDAAIPRTLGDLQRKEADDAFYAAHAALFLQEMDSIVSRVPRIARIPRPPSPSQTSCASSITFYSTAW